jgi:cation-transporting ATPase E
VTFDSARKWSAIVFDGDCMQGLRVLGAPEMLMPHLAFDRGIEEASRDWAEQGLRVLLYARRPGLGRVGFDDLEPKLPSGLEPAGLIVLSDELRTDASETIARFAEAGVGLKIISGDHPDTVTSLARQAGFIGDLKAVSGAELDALLPEEVLAAAEEATVFGRVSPRHKQRLLEALREKGHYVRIGDGVNDVPALKTAEVAIAVRSGSAVSRGIADTVLLDDSFSALPAAFLEGQRIRKDGDHHPPFPGPFAFAGHNYPPRSIAPRGVPRFTTSYGRHRHFDRRPAVASFRYLVTTGQSRTVRFARGPRVRVAGGLDHWPHRRCRLSRL